jgi:hypothetical protein
MAAKRKKKINVDTLVEQDEISISLKERYFKLLKKENFGKTPNTTQILDKLEITIKERKEQLQNECA